MRILIASADGAETAWAIHRAAEAQGWSTHFWTNPDAVFPQGTSAYDVTIYVGPFESRHNPGGRRIFWGANRAEKGAENFALDDRQGVAKALGLKLDEPAPSAVAGNVYSPASEPRIEAPPEARPLRATPVLDLLAALPVTRFVGFLHDASGYGEAARHQLWALHNAGLRVEGEVVTGTIDFGGGRGHFGLEVESLLGEAADAELHVYHLSPDVALKVRRGRGRHVCVVPWETTAIPREWVEILNDNFDAAWVPTRWQRDVFRRCGVRSVEAVPFHLDPQWYDLEGPKFRLPGGPRKADEMIFYSIFQWSERKAPERLLAAYLSEFRASDNVRLVLKTYPFTSHADDRAAVERLLRETISRCRSDRELPPVELIVQRLTRAETHAVHRACDVFVSLHRGEGWGFPIQEAMLLGKPAIFTSAGATDELWREVDCDEPACMRVGATWTPVRGIDFGWYRLDQLWAEPDVKHAMTHMRQARTRRASAEQCRDVGRGPTLQAMAEAVKAAWATLENNGG